MQWQLEGVNVKPSDSLSQYAEQRIRRPMLKMATWVRGITLRFRDTDLGDLEAGRHIKAVANLANGAVVVVEQPAPDFYGGVDLVANRLKRGVRRRRERHLLRRHRHRPRPAG